MVRPQNLVVIVSEHHGAALLGAAGSSLIRTPNLDRLATLGTRFSNYCTNSPICVPARASMACGLYPHQSGYWDNSLPYDGRVPSWMRRLRDAGHEVVSIGKLHFRSSADDNGFTEEIEAMHVVDGLGELIGLLRASGDEPVRGNVWEMYASGHRIGTDSPYQEYDRRIAERACRWIAQHQGRATKPWVLCVHFAGAHPPFVVPQRLLDRYPESAMPLPVQFSPAERPRHPALEHLRRILDHAPTMDEARARQITAFYLAALSQVDERIGNIVGAIEASGLLPDTRIVYTSDHGFSCGHHYIFGLFNLYQETVNVPLIISGPDIPAARIVGQISTHVDLYATFLEALGLAPDASERRTLPGCSLWPAIEGMEATRSGFAEYHAAGSAAGAFMLRDGDDKLVYHVGMPPQLFNLREDPRETMDRADEPRYAERLHALERALRIIVDPEQADASAKRDQRQRVEELGGKEKVLALRAGFKYSPPPGVKWQDT